MSLHADSPPHWGVFEHARSPLLWGVCFGRASLAPVSTFPGQAWGENSIVISRSIFAIDWSGAQIRVFQTETSCQLVTGSRCKLLLLATSFRVRETLYNFSLSLCWMCIHLHFLNQKTVRNCALRDNQRNCFSSSEMHGQNWSLGVLTGLFSKKETYKCRGCKITL